jgi:four helix bundle protein
MAGKTYDLEDRLLEYAAQIISVTEKLKNTRAACHVGDQLLRAGTSPYFNHGEAESAESPRDFIHKLKVCLKELRESWRALRLIKKASLSNDASLIDAALTETDELIRIFVASIRTAQQKAVRERPDGTATSAFDVRCSVFDVQPRGEVASP